MEVTYENVNLMDDIFFSIVMEDEHAGCCMLSIILAKDIVEVVQSDAQVEVQNALGKKKVRYDLLARDSNGTIYIVEVQKEGNDNMVKRSRFYHSMLDIQLLSKGKYVRYKNIPDSYCIFICDFDPIGLGAIEYTYKNYSIKHHSFLNDGTTKIFLNTQGKADNETDKRLVHFLKYLVNTTDVNAIMCKELRELNDIVKQTKRDNRKKEKYMDMKKAFVEEGKDEGKSEVLKTLYINGMSVEQIAAGLKCSTEEVEYYLDNTYDCMEYLKSKIGKDYDLIPEASKRNCKTIADCNSLLKNLGIEV